MEKRKRKEIKKQKKSEAKRELSLNTKRNLKFLGIDNCLPIYLSPQTQRYVGCQIGEHITVEKPWINIKKEKIEDSLFLHENSSEFFPLCNLIENYPEETMLIGSYRTNQTKIEEFMICTTIEAKLQILELLEKEKEAIIEKVKNLIYCQPNKWDSLGSEVEVDDNLSKNYRKLYEVEYDSTIPIIIGSKKVQFKCRLASVNPKSHTYDEILPDGRFVKNLVFKIRIDRASQISLERISIETQTILTCPKRKYTQTDEVFIVLTLTEPENKKLNDNLMAVLKFMEDTLLVNFHINLYMNDYQFPNAYNQSYARQSKELMNFQDVINCKDLCYGSISWNSLISGLIAVSYMKIPRKLIVNQKYGFTDKIYSPHDSNMVLLWCYTDDLMPKLYIHANFEITSLSFCPYDENILVGGSCAGQIFVWDLKNKLQQVESKEYLTMEELNHRNFMRSQTTWMKGPPGMRHVYPTIISNINVSHKSPVVRIQWLPSYQYLTKMGQIENMYVKQTHRKTYLEPSKSYQFLTCAAEDSCLYAWEIKHSSYMLKPERSTRKQPRRLTRIPEFLAKGRSLLTKYNKDFCPFFKLKLELPGEKDKKIFVTNFILNTPKYKYVATNPSTLDNYKERTFFKKINPLKPAPPSQKFVFFSTSGYLAECNWSANNFDQGLATNEQVCDVKMFMAIHDGPILSCQSNVFYPECILTVGGSVFGIWLTSIDKKPIFWRKGRCRYVSGMWSFQFPLLCMILRQDSCMEYWDLNDYAIKPLRKMKLKGSQIIDVITDSNRRHTRKKTYLLTDIKGCIKVQDHAVYTKELTSKEIEASTVTLLNNMLIRKKHAENVNEQLKKEHNLSKMHIFGTSSHENKEPLIVTKSDVFDQRKYQNEMQQQFYGTKWQQQEEVRMYETLLQQKKINMDVLEQNMKPLMEKLSKRQEQQRKIDKKIALKEIIYENERNNLLAITNITKRQKISVSFPIEMEKLVKKKYMEDYKVIERDILDNMKKSRLSINLVTIMVRRKTEFQEKNKNNQF